MRTLVFIEVGLVATTASGALFDRITSAIFSPAQQIFGLDPVQTLYDRVGIYEPQDQIPPEDVKLGGAIFDPVTWTLTTDKFDPNHYQTAPYVSNGYFGQALPSEGVGYWIERNLSASEGSWELNGWPLDQPRATFGTVAGFWNLQEKVKYPSLPENILRGGESVISGIPDWTGLTITTAKGSSYMPGVDKSTIKRYRQSMSLQNGIVHTEVTWAPPDEESIFQLNFTVLAHRTRVNLGLVRLVLTVSGATDFTVTDILDGAGATRAHFGDKEIRDDLMWTSVKPWGIENTTAYVASTVKFSGLDDAELEEVERSRKDAFGSPWVSSNMSTIAQSWNFSFRKPTARTFTIYKYVGIASSDAFPKSTQSTALNAALAARQLSWSQLVREHTEDWDETWKSADIIIPGDEHLQITTRASLFHLLANSRSGLEPHGLGDNSILVGGLSSDSYAGLVFWDSDVWMYPSLLLLHPEHAMSINNYRTRLLAQAIENAQSYNYSGLLYPWTSGRFGNCTATGVCKDYQYHLNHDVAQAHWHWYLHSKDDTWLNEKGWPTIKNAADMFANYVVKNDNDGTYETKTLGEPDEFAWNINNGAYTNVGIKLLLGDWGPAAANVLGLEVPKNWSDIAEHMKIPYDKDEDIIVEYEGMDGTVQIKQASVTLINYPLGWSINERQAQNDMTFYSAANVADGPAMTWSMFAIGQAQLQEQGCAAYTYLLHGSEPYIRAPFFQFSEQRSDTWNNTHMNVQTQAAFPFLTGYGGYLQVFTHGFTGMRPKADALFLDPVMVPQIPQGVTLKGVKYQGASFDIQIGLVNTTITRRDDVGRMSSGSNEPMTVRIGGKASMPGDYPLLRDESLTVPTRRPDLNGTVIEGNLVQCRPVMSDEKYVPGNLPISVVDGSNATLWQPASPQAASITLDIGRVTPIKGMSINWGPTPPESVRVSASSESREEYEEIFWMKKVEISAPYKVEDVKIVRIKQGNETSIRFKSEYHARYVRLTMEGTLGNDKSVGATVAEIAVV